MPKASLIHLIYLVMYLMPSLVAEEKLSLIELPAELNQNEPFQVLHAQFPKLHMLWTEPSKEIMLPYSNQSQISIVQNQQTWNLETQALGQAQKDSIFQTWHRAAKLSEHRKWREIPLKRKFFLALLCLPFAVICYNARKKQHYALLACGVLAIYFVPTYQHKIIIHSDSSWEISKNQLNNWLKWDGQSMVGLEVSQNQRPKIETTSSEFNEWLVPELESLGQIDRLWHSQHHVATLWRR